MSEYRLVPVEKLKEWEAAINTIALQAAFDIADDIAQYSYAPAVQGEPVYLYRRRGLDDFVTCDFTRYTELSGKTNLFETKILYTATLTTEQQSAPDVAELQAELERERKRRFDGNEQASREHRADVKALVEALEGIMRVEARDRIMPVGAEWDAARAALAAHRKGGEK